MSKPIKRVVVTGGAGQIAYSLLFRIANGDMLGKDQPVALQILEVPQALEALKGVMMELYDCAFPLLRDVMIGDEAHKVFKDADYALLVGAKPRGPGMERSDLLSANGKIFIEQGKALNDVASPDVKVLVVGNPCNTNCLIAMSNAPKIPKKNFHAMTRLDQNRATALLSKKTGADITEVTNVTIWGNHSNTQVPDYFNSKVRGQAALEVIGEKQWFEETFIPQVQKRGGEIIKLRGKSSAASAANAAIDAIKALVRPTPEGQWFSSGVSAVGNPYGIDQNLVFSFPCRSKGDGHYEIVENVLVNEQLNQKLKATEQELIEERNLVGQLVGVS